MTKKKPDETLVLRLKSDVFPVETGGIRFHPDRYLHLCHGHRVAGSLIFQLMRVAFSEARELRLSRFKDSGPGNSWGHIVEAAAALEACGMIELSRG